MTQITYTSYSRFPGMKGEVVGQVRDILIVRNDNPFDRSERYFAVRDGQALAVTAWGGYRDKTILFYKLINTADDLLAA